MKLRRVIPSTSEEVRPGQVARKHVRALKSTILKATTEDISTSQMRAIKLTIKKSTFAHFDIRQVSLLELAPAEHATENLRLAQSRKGEIDQVKGAFRNLTCDPFNSASIQPHLITPVNLQVAVAHDQVLQASGPFRNHYKLLGQFVTKHCCDLSVDDDDLDRTALPSVSEDPNDRPRLDVTPRRTLRKGI